MITITEDTQPAHLARVSARIARHILRFLAVRTGEADGSADPGRPQGATFHMAELLAFVRSADPSIAPDSPSRVLRDMRAQGLVNYRVINRRDSLYEVKPAAGPESAMGEAQR